MKPTIRDLKPHVPAKDFELSKRFYSALGFAMSEGWGGTADFELGGSRFGRIDHGRPACVVARRAQATRS